MNFAARGFLLLLLFFSSPSSHTRHASPLFGIAARIYVREYIRRDNWLPPSATVRPDRVPLLPFSPTAFHSPKKVAAALLEKRKKEEEKNVKEEEEALD